MLANKREYPNEEKRPHGFYKIMSSLKKKGYIKTSNRNGKKIYRLTVIGWGEALLRAKEFDTAKEYQPLGKKNEVEVWIIRK